MSIGGIVFGPIFLMMTPLKYDLQHVIKYSSKGITHLFPIYFQLVVDDFEDDKDDEEDDDDDVFMPRKLFFFNISQFMVSLCNTCNFFHGIHLQQNL